MASAKYEYQHSGLYMSMEHNIQFTLTMRLREYFFCATFFNESWYPLYVANTYNNMLEMALELKKDPLLPLYVVVHATARHEGRQIEFDGVVYEFGRDGFVCLSEHFLSINGHVDPALSPDLIKLIDEERDQLTVAGGLNQRAEIIIGWTEEVATGDYRVNVLANVMDYPRDDDDGDDDGHHKSILQIYDVYNFTTMDTPPLYQAPTIKEYKRKVLSLKNELEDFVEKKGTDDAATMDPFKHIIMENILNLEKHPMNFLVYDYRKVHSRYNDGRCGVQ